MVDPLDEELQPLVEPQPLLEDDVSPDDELLHPLLEPLAPLVLPDDEDEEV